EIEKIEKVVAGFSKHHDLSRVAEVAHEVQVLLQQIKEAQKAAKDFNNKEMLFGVEITEYKQLTRIVRNFQPYADLWLTAYDWTKWQHEWRTDPFESLNANEIKENVSNASKK